MVSLGYRNPEMMNAQESFEQFGDFSTNPAAAPMTQSSRHTPCAVRQATAHGVCLLLWVIGAAVGIAEKCRKMTVDQFDIPSGPVFGVHFPLRPLPDSHRREAVGRRRPRPDEEPGVIMGPGRHSMKTITIEVPDNLNVGVAESEDDLPRALRLAAAIQ